jgi:hypothetical protein
LGAGRATSSHGATLRYGTNLARLGLVTLGPERRGEIEPTTSRPSRRFLVCRCPRTLAPRRLRSVSCRLRPRLRQEVYGHLAPDAHPLAIAVMREAVEAAPAGSASITCRIALTWSMGSQALRPGSQRRRVATLFA